MHRFYIGSINVVNARALSGSLAGGTAGAWEAAGEAAWHAAWHTAGHAAWGTAGLLVDSHHDGVEEVF